MTPALLFLFLLLVIGILIPEIDCFSPTTSLSHIMRGRGVQALNLTVGLNGECNGEEPGGKITALSRKAGGSRGGSGKGAPGSGGSDISHQPRSKVSAAPSTSSDPIFLTIMGLACGALL